MRKGRSHRYGISAAVRHALAGVLALALWAAEGGADAAESPPAAEKGVYTLPSRMCGPFFLLPMNLPTGKKDERGQLTFLLDTGARITAVDPEAYGRLTGRKIRPGARVDLTDGHIGPLTFTRLAASARDLDHLTQALGHSFDGILGFSAFRDFLLTVDYPNRRVRLSRGTLPPPDGREVFDASGSDIRPFLKIHTGGRTHRVLIDTGSASTFALRREKGMRWRSPPVPVKAFMRIRRLEMRKAGRLEGEMRFGRHRIRNPLIYLTANKTELMGGEALKHFTVTFDQKVQRVRLRRTERDPLEMPPLSETGAMLRPRPDGLQVVTVLKGTPAEEAGLRAGDLIVSANGKEAVKRGCPGERNGTGTEVTYQVKRGRELVTLNVRRAVLVK